MHLEQITSRLHFARTKHANWTIYRGPDGLVLLDSGYLGQRAELEESLGRVGRSPGDVDAVLVTHAHADHLGGASWLADEYGVPVFGGEREVPHLRREFLEQVGPPDVLRNAFRPGVLAWAVEILPLLRGQPGLAVPSARAVPESGGRVDVPGRPAAVAVSGHTTGSTMFHFEEEGAVVVGDALVTGHRTSRRSGPQLLLPMFHADTETARRSLVHLAALDAEVLLPGHGPSWAGKPADAVARALVA